MSAREDDNSSSFRESLLSDTFTEGKKQSLEGRVDTNKGDPNRLVVKVVHVTPTLTAAAAAVVLDRHPALPKSTEPDDAGLTVVDGADVGGETTAAKGFHGGFSSATTTCLLYTSPSPRDATLSRMPSSA